MEGVLFLWRDEVKAIDEIMFNEKNQFEVFVLKVGHGGLEGKKVMVI